MNAARGRQQLKRPHIEANQLGHFVFTAVFADFQVGNAFFIGQLAHLERPAGRDEQLIAAILELLEHGLKEHHVRGVV